MFEIQVRTVQIKLDSLVVLRLLLGMLHDDTSVRQETGHRTAHMVRDAEDSLVRARLVQLRGDQLLDREDHAVFASQRDRGARIIDRLLGILHLKDSAIR